MTTIDVDDPYQLPKPARIAMRHGMKVVLFPPYDGWIPTTREEEIRHLLSMLGLPYRNQYWLNQVLPAYNDVRDGHRVEVVLTIPPEDPGDLIGVLVIYRTDLP